jgi:hypothetical protein
MFIFDTALILSFNMSNTMMPSNYPAYVNIWEDSKYWDDNNIWQD